MNTFIYFDVVKTLIHPRAPIGEIYAEFAAAVGISADAEALNKAFPFAWKSCRAAAGAYPPYGRTRHDALLFWSQTIRQTFGGAGVSSVPQSLCHQLFEYFATADAWRIYPGMEEALALIPPERCGALSNFDVRLEELLLDLGIRRCFSSVISASSAGAEKPDPAIFRAAEIAAPPAVQRFVLIGDDPERDGEGARAAGWTSWIIDPQQPGNYLKETIAKLQE